MLLLEFREVGNAHPARPAPRGPELDDVDLAGLEGGDRSALPERFDFELRGRIAHSQALAPRRCLPDLCRRCGLLTSGALPERFHIRPKRLPSLPLNVREPGQG